MMYRHAATPPCCYASRCLPAAPVTRIEPHAAGDDDARQG